MQIANKLRPEVVNTFGAGCMLGVAVGVMTTELLRNDWSFRRIWKHQKGVYFTTAGGKPGLARVSKG